MHGRWAGGPEPVPSTGVLAGILGDVQFQIWDPNIWHLAGSGRTLPPDSDPEPLDIAIQFDEEQDAFGWSNASYQPPNLWRNETWRLGTGEYAVNVTIRAGGQKWADDFVLQNQGSRRDLRLTKKGELSPA
jgi:hypothetical protein